ncbi:diguanylate cyclase, partial [Vibrio cholerae]|nr:diguanylate cyclase [Vibrio cholerae]
VKFSEEIEQDIPESCLYIKSPELNEQQSPSSISTGEIPSLVTPKIRGSLVWQDGSGELAAEETYTSFNSFTLGHFRERVIEAFSSL